jgi:hypothetical protein
MSNELTQARHEEDSETFRFSPTVSTIALAKNQLSVIQEHLGAPASARISGLDSLFQQLVREWKQDTEYVSALDEIFLHPSYQRIIGLGDRATDLILASFVRNLDHWDWALRAITGADPVPTEDEGDLERTRTAWLRWASESGHEASVSRY